MRDAAARTEALDIQRSFIIQAPAGSGKTELLIQRFLALLCTVAHPEEIIAITFTKKAASEMRTRIALALQQDPIALKTVKTKELVERVLIHAEQKHWDLLNTPNRLRVMTIDALCHSLARQMPILTRFGSEPQIDTSPRPLYEKTISLMIDQLSEDVPWSAALQTLLLHLDNRIDSVTGLLTTMLGKRDQWLPLLSRINSVENTADLRIYLEQALQATVIETLTLTRAEFPEALIEPLCRLARFAASNVPAHHPIAVLADLSSLPEATLSALPQWHGLQAFLQVKDCDWRKRVTINEGFPAASNAESADERACYKLMKEQMTELLLQLTDFATLGQQLANCSITALPKPHYSDQQWTVLSALITVLNYANALLQIEFTTRDHVDFIAIMQMALTALGDSEAPTDLALSLDYQIRHILVDEFQDTSHSQFRLLEKLTAGWQPGDGRTLFLVGDPMQSIYRFREADVGLFLRARAHGLGSVTLVPLQLTSNFRSEAALVNWNNALFSVIFPRVDHLATGQVSFAASEPVVTDNSIDSGVELNLFASAEKLSDHLIQLIRPKQQQGQRVAILIRARTHLETILPALQQANLPYVAVEIETLADRSIIQDLMALTRALIHPADSVAWLAVLRAPWCGVTLPTLHQLIMSENSETQSNLTIPALLTRFDLSVLPIDEAARLQRVLPILQNAIKQRRRADLAHVINAVWLALGGPAAVRYPNDLDNATVFFDLLAELQQGGWIEDIGLLEDRLYRLFAASDHHAENPIQIMTIHKAKGLEFDCVVVPGLEKGSANDARKLLLYMEKTREIGRDSDLLLAPIKASTEQEDDPLYRYIKQQNKNKDRQELCRLLYVAATRAKSSLHLLGICEKQQSENTASFLQLLQRAPHLDTMPPVTETIDLEIDDNAMEAIETTTPPIPLQRLSLAWQHPFAHIITKKIKPAAQAPVFNPVVRNKKFSNAVRPENKDQIQRYAREVGLVIHQWLLHAAEIGFTTWCDQHSVDQSLHWQNQLRHFGVLSQNMAGALDILQKAHQKMRASTRLSWILASEHSEAAQEWAIQHAISATENKHFILDRTFVERQNNTRWIIDYKTTVPDPDLTLEQFYQTQINKHTLQLSQYARALLSRENRAIMLALYFPIIDGWIAWPFDLA